MTAEYIFCWILSKVNLFLVHQIFHIVKGVRIPTSLTILWMILAILFIYNNEMAEVQYTSPGMGDEDLEIRLRASKSSDDISGVYDANMEDVEGDYGSIDIKHRYSPETSTDIFDFEKDGTHYCITISGEASQMQIAEIMDNALLACGVSA